MDPALTEKTILCAANKMFLRHGYRRTTVEDIAKEAGIGKGTVYLHFKSKEHLGEAWMRRWHDDLFQRMVEAAETEATWGGKIQAALVHRVLGRYCKLEIFEASIGEVLESLDELIRKCRAEFAEREAGLIAGFILSGVSAGEFKDCDAAPVSRAMIAATSGLLPYNVRPEHLGARSEVEAQALAIATLLVQAISKS